ncbi:hypothetical protein [Streptomyces sp. Midd1]|uniref:hypothetical protein n=1 Tax=Streptomyces sp. Midd3 TaxID=3161191 RepID=UPI0034DB46EC
MKQHKGNGEIVDLVVDSPSVGADSDGQLHWINIYPGRALRYDDIPTDVRKQWDETWERLVKRVQEKYADPAYSLRYDN